jgi:FkbM family methyltransferase
MNVVERIRQELVKNPMLASLKHLLISPLLGFIYIPLGKKGLILHPKYRLKLYSHCTSVWILVEVFEDDVYERMFKVEKGDIVVDVGAHVGMFTVKALKEVGEEGLVIAIEPEERNFELLKRNTRGYRNVKLVKKAIGDKTGRAILYISELSGEHSIKRSSRATKSIDVEVDTLDNILSSLGVSKVDFLKIDVEGAELEVLRGAGGYLSEGKIRKVAVAAYHYCEEHKEVADFLSYYGFLVKKTQVKEKWYVYGWRRRT